VSNGENYRKLFDKPKMDLYLIVKN